MASKEMTVKEKKEIDKAAGESTRPGPVFVPAVDIFENVNEIILLADMPGVDSKDVDIDLREGKLTIQGRIDRVEDEKESLVYQEFNWGDYSRQFSLSDVIDQNRITAKMDQGVLRLTLPKVEKAKPRRIEVASS
jgi:HSP20 family molecular chaperone IbpA